MIVGITLLLAVMPNQSMRRLANIRVPKWAQSLKSSDKWEIAGTEIFAHAKIIKWLLLAILKTCLIILSFFSTLLKVALSAASSFFQKTKKI